MDITWFGHSCFMLTEKGCATLVTDPYNASIVGHKKLDVAADIVTISHHSPGHDHVAAIKGDPFVIDGPGEYEFGDVFVVGVQTDRNLPEERNTVYVYHYNDLAVAHLGNVSRIPNQSELEALGNIDIALIPVGGQSWTASQAAELVSIIAPSYVIPMHYATEESVVDLVPLQKFLKEMGVDASTPADVFSIKSDAPVLSEETRIIVLKYQN
ncbi:MAG: MBL fold metallo-hydrolase [Anaerolineaceae bacterium]|nr:MBL fold metallo-hydrolase [Anaerolineaceae bacterium]